jgi:serine/threonine-protein kinase
METVVVQLSALLGEPPALIKLGPGQSATFGRGAPGEPVDIELADRGVSRLAGELVATADYWRMSNLTAEVTFVVENLEGAGEHVKVGPGRLGAPIPFELSRVLVPVTDGTRAFNVYAPEHVFAEEHRPGAGEPTVSPFSLDLTAKYFLVLVALCEPRLRDPSSVAIPALGDVVERLRPIDSWREVTGTAVNFHIDYLATHKLRIRQRTGTEHSARVEWKREALVAMALRFNLVRQEHLALLPTPSLKA